MKMSPAIGDSAYEYAPSLVLDLAENSLHHEHHLGEVIRYKAAYHSQYYREGDPVLEERLALCEEEFGVIAFEDVRHSGPGYRGNQERHYCEAGQIDHQHLYGEKHTGYRSPENSGYTC